MTYKDFAFEGVNKEAKRITKEDLEDGTLQNIQLYSNLGYSSYYELEATFANGTRSDRMGTG